MTYYERMSDPTPHTHKITSDVGPKKTLLELVQWCEERGLNAGEVWMPTTYLCHNHTETPGEVAERQERAKRASEREREWVRTRYAQLFGQQDQ